MRFVRLIDSSWNAIKETRIEHAFSLLVATRLHNLHHYRLSITLCPFISLFHILLRFLNLISQARSIFPRNFRQRWKVTMEKR